MYYLPRTLFKKDGIFREDVLSVFKRGYFIEMYPKNVQGFGGEKDILTKFGVEVREQITFVVARRRYEEEIGVRETSRVDRPLEGDLVYLPINDGLYEIKFVDHDTPFYQISGRYVYELRCEKFEYASERIDTGIEILDSIEDRFSLDKVGVYELVSENNEILQTEINEDLVEERTSIEEKDPGAQNSVFQTESVGIINFSEKNPFGDRI